MAPTAQIGPDTSIFQQQGCPSSVPMSKRVAAATDCNARTWHALAPKAVEALGVLLDSGTLRSARLVCRHWCSHVTAQVAACPDSDVPVVSLHPDVEQYARTLAAVKRCLPRIKACKVYLSSRVPAEVVVKELVMLSLLPDLRSLELSTRELVPRNPTLGGTPEVLPQCGALLTALTAIRLRGRREAPASGCLPFLRQLPALREVTLESNERLEDLVVARALPQLQRVALSVSLSERPTTVFFRQLTSIQHLELTGGHCRIFLCELRELMETLHQMRHLKCVLGTFLLPPFPITTLVPPERMRLPLGAPGNPTLSVAVELSTQAEDHFDTFRVLRPHLCELEVRSHHWRPISLLVESLSSDLTLVGLSGRPSSWALSARPQDRPLLARQHPCHSFQTVYSWKLLRPAPPGNPTLATHAGPATAAYHQHAPATGSHNPHAAAAGAAAGDALLAQQERQQATAARQQGPNLTLASLQDLSLLSNPFTCAADAYQLLLLTSLQVLSIAQAGADAVPIPVVALPPSLTRLSLTALDLALQPACCSTARVIRGGHACGIPPATPTPTPWPGLPLLRVLHLDRCRLAKSAPLAHLLSGTPRLRELKFGLDEGGRLGWRAGEAPLAGCVAGVTSLKLMTRSSAVVEVPREAHEDLGALLAACSASLRRLGLKKVNVADLAQLLAACPLRNLHLLRVSREQSTDAALTAVLRKLPLADVQPSDA